MTNPQRRCTGDRWDGWDDPDYQPTDEELNEPVKVNATPEELAEALSVSEASLSRMRAYVTRGNPRSGSMGLSLIGLQVAAGQLGEMLEILGREHPDDSADRLVGSGQGLQSSMP